MLDWELTAYHSAIGEITCCLTRRGHPSQPVEPLSIDLHAFDKLCSNTKTKSLQHCRQRLAIDKIQRRCAISLSLCLGISGEPACGDYQTLVCSTDHGAPEVTHHARWH